MGESTVVAPQRGHCQIYVGIVYKQITVLVQYTTGMFYVYTNLFFSGNYYNQYIFIIHL